ncbi:MAG: hypothetical protein CSA72_05265 [Rhodobacterales bacterium]|nr:MAG: hypothetical protein CSA72_05265 [Rhodobacterales bacterium]
MGAPLDFDTDRLTVRDWTAELGSPPARARLETELAEGLTPPVVAPLPPSLQMAADGVTGWIARQAREASVATLRLRGGGDLVGLLIVSPQQGAWHIGYLLMEPFWARGYASEALRGLVRAAPERQFRAGVAADNPASERVLIKAGFRRVSDGAMRLYARDPRARGD